MPSVELIKAAAESWYAGRRKKRHGFEMLNIAVATVAFVAGPAPAVAAFLYGFRKMLGKQSEFTISEGMDVIRKTNDPDVAAAFFKAMKDKHGA